jgi:uncharacterized membrane protein YebE (DUF533 family)
MFTEQGPSLAQVRREGAERAGREFLEALHAEHGDNISAIARAAQTTRYQVRVYLRRYGIGACGRERR